MVKHEDDPIVDEHDLEDDDDGEDIEFSADEEDEEDDEEVGMSGDQVLYALLHETFHLPPEDDDDDEEVGKNICEVIDDSMSRMAKAMETQNKILLKILTQLSNK